MLKVDLIHLPSLGTGQTVYSENLAKELKNLVDLKVITPNQSSIYNLINHFNNSLAIKLLPFLLTRRIRKNSLVHITNQELFFLVKKISNKVVFTLQDFGSFTYYKEWTKKDIELLDKADKIICSSNFSKNELVKSFPSFQEKAVVVYNGLEEGLNKSNQNTRKKYNLKNQRIILFVGSDEPKKNFFTLLRAFSELKEKNLVLIKIGSKWTFFGENERKKFQEFIEEKNLTEKVVFLDFVPKQDLIDFYLTSEIFVQPSFHEGFGLTLLEAMNCSCPVLCSDILPFHEVAGNSALFFGPKKETELTEKIELVLNNKKIKKELIRKGSENIKRFSWKKTAVKTLKVYKEALNETKA